MKIVFFDDAHVEIEQADGTMKHWKEKLTAQEQASIVAAGMLMLKCSMFQCLLANTDQTNRKLSRLEKTLIKATDLAKEIMTAK